MDFINQLNLKSGAVTANLPPIKATQTWDNSGVVFTAIDLDVTDTASSISSKLLDLKRGGSSQFSVDKNGTVSCVAFNALSFASVGGEAVITTDAAQTITNKTIGGNNLLTAVEGFIQGCKLEYVNTTTIRVTPGIAYIQSSGKLLKLAANDDTTPSLSANTWYHVYLYLNGSTVDTEVSTTAPAAPWVGTARSKTSDTTRRYLGSFRTNSSSEIKNFYQDGSGSHSFVSWRLVTATQTRALSAGTATSNQDVSLTDHVPPVCRTAYVRLFSNADKGLRTDADDMTGTNPTSAAGYAAISGAGGDVYLPHPVNSSQTLRYAFIAAITNGGGAYVDVYGYFLER